MASPKNYFKREVPDVDKPNVVMSWESDVHPAHIDVEKVAPRNHNPIKDEPTEATDYQVKAYVTRPPGYLDDFVVSRRETSKEEARKVAVRWMREHPDPTPPEMGE